MKKKITIIITCFNHQKYLRKCLTSVLKQKKNKLPFDIILIDDKSTDNSLKISQKILKNSTNAKIIKNHKNLGLTKTCNKVIKNCKTKYFIRLDSDDYISEYFIHNFEKVIFKKEYDLIACNRVEFTKSKKKLVNITKGKLDIFKLISCGIALKTKKIINIGMYKNVLWEEYDLYIRYVKSNYRKVYIIKNYMYYYRKHKLSMSSNKIWIKKAWKQLVLKYGKKTLLKYGKIPQLNN